MNIFRKFEYDSTYMDIADCMANLSYANRNKVGAVIVSENGQLISQGFNGTPTGSDNCCEIVECSCKWRHGCSKCGRPISEVYKTVDFCKGCEYCKLVTKQEVLHAESNALSKCARFGGASSENSTIYVTLSPCIECAKLIIQSGVKRVVFKEIYRNLDGVKLLVNSGIIVNKLDKDNHIISDINWNNYDDKMNQLDIYVDKADSVEYRTALSGSDKHKQYCRIHKIYRI